MNQRDYRSTAPHLRTLLRPPSRPANRQRLDLYSPKTALFSHPVAPFLDALVVIDGAHTRTFLTQAQVADWDLEPEVILRQGLANLDPTAGLKSCSDPQGLWQVKPPDGYASSRLMMPGWLDAFSEKCVGVPVAALPVAGLLLVADSARPKAIAELVSQAWTLYSTEAHPVSPVPYVPNGHFGLKPWEPIEDHALQSQLTRAFLYLAGKEYADQFGLLTEWADSQDPKPFIAPFLMMKRQGAMGGLTVLPNRPSLIPMATWVRQGTEDPKAELPVKGWQELVANGTIRSPEPQWNPPRWLVP